jgi:3-oxoadipate enol-lactonase
MADVQKGYAEINGAKIYYEAAGQGHPIMFIHAWIADNTMWDAQFTEFAKDYRVIRYDNRGFGNTEPVDGEATTHDDLYDLLKFLGVDKTYLVGCSNGGGVSMNFTLLHPQMVDALVMVGSGPGGLELDVPQPPQFTEAEAAWKAGNWERLLELETQVWFDGLGRAPDQVDQKARQHAIEMNRKVMAHEQKKLGSLTVGINPPAVERLDELNLAVLVICGSHDTPYSLAAADYMEKHIKGAKKVILPGTAHLPSLEVPTAFNQVLRGFLNSLPK